MNSWQRLGAWDSCCLSAACRAAYSQVCRVNASAPLGTAYLFLNVCVCLHCTLGVLQDCAVQVLEQHH